MPPQVLSETIEAHSAICAVLDKALGADVSTDERLLALAVLMVEACADEDGDRVALLVQACRQGAALHADGTATPLSTCQVLLCLHEL